MAETLYLNSTKTCYVKRHTTGVSVYYSYTTPIAVYFGRENTGYRTDKKFSVTTSKQISTYIKADLLGDLSVLKVVPHEVFQNILSDLKLDKD